MNNLCSAWVGKYKGYHTKGGKKKIGITKLRTYNTSIYPSVHPSICLSIHPFTHLLFTQQRHNTCLLYSRHCFGCISEWNIKKY